MASHIIEDITMMKRIEEELCPVHEEMQKRLDERWTMHITTMETNFGSIKADLKDITSRLRNVEIRIWMFLGAIALLLFIIEKWPKLTDMIKGH